MIKNGIGGRSFLISFYFSLFPQRHHFAQAISILNSEGCNIFENCSRKVKTKRLENPLLLVCGLFPLALIP